MYVRGHVYLDSYSPLLFLWSLYPSFPKSSHLKCLGPFDGCMLLFVNCNPPANECSLLQPLKARKYLVKVMGILQSDPVASQAAALPLHLRFGITSTKMAVGIMPMDFADEYSSAQVLGIDLSPIQPQWVPPNCKFLVDDLESDWVLNRQFDFIHGRALEGSIREWAKLYQQVYNPGGWIEMQEYEGLIFSDDDPELKKSPYILEWQTNLDEATASIGKKLAVARKQKNFLQEAGFVNVKDKIFQVPCGRWARDPELKELGWVQLAHMIDSVEPYTLGPFTRILGWSLEETQVLIAKVRNELRHKGNHLYLQAHFIFGKKPQD